MEFTRSPYLTWGGEQTQPPCICCGDRCVSQLEHMESNGYEPWPMCSACDPALDEYGSDWLCLCREARGDANWERPEDDLFAKLEAMTKNDPQHELRRAEALNDGPIPECRDTRGTQPRPTTGKETA